LKKNIFFKSNLKTIEMCDKLGTNLLHDPIFNKGFNYKIMIIKLISRPLL